MNVNMNVQEIKAYCEAQLEKSNRLIPTERTGSYYEEQLRLRTLWIASDQAESLAMIAGSLDKLYIFADENPELQDIAKKLARIGTIIENATDK